MVALKREKFRFAYRLVFPFCVSCSELESILERMCHTVPSRIINVLLMQKQPPNEPNSTDKFIIWFGLLKITILIVFELLELHFVKYCTYVWFFPYIAKVQLITLWVDFVRRTRAYRATTNIRLRQKKKNEKSVVALIFPPGVTRIQPTPKARSSSTNEYSTNTRS